MNNAGLRSPAVRSQRVAQTVRRSVRPSVGTELVSVPSAAEREGEQAGRWQERTCTARDSASLQAASTRGIVGVIQEVLRRRASSRATILRFCFDRGRGI